jgi:hypothetical protein
MPCGKAISASAASGEAVWANKLRVILEKAERGINT